MSDNDHDSETGTSG